jgi:hypothetical protein
LLEVVPQRLLVVEEHLFLGILEGHVGGDGSRKVDDPPIVVVVDDFYFCVEHFEFVLEEFPELADVEGVGDVGVVVEEDGLDFVGVGHVEVGFEGGQVNRTGPVRKHFGTQDRLDAQAAHGCFQLVVLVQDLRWALLFHG